MNHRSRSKRTDLPMGVRKLGGGFQARLRFMGKQMHLGVYGTPEEAHAVYAAKRQEVFGEFA